MDYVWFGLMLLVELIGLPFLGWVAFKIEEAANKYWAWVFMVLITPVFVTLLLLIGVPW